MWQLDRKKRHLNDVSLTRKKPTTTVYHIEVEPRYGKLVVQHTNNYFSIWVRQCKKNLCVSLAACIVLGVGLGLGLEWLADFRVRWEERKRQRRHEERMELVQY